MRDVDDQDVGARPDHFDRALEIVTGRAHRGADTQPSLRITRGERVALLVEQILRGDETEQGAVRVNEG